MGNCVLPGCADALLNAKNAKVTPAEQRTKPIKTRGLKKADGDADFFFIVNFPSVYSDEVPILPEPPSGCHAFFLSGNRQQSVKVVDLAPLLHWDPHLRMDRAF